MFKFLDENFNEMIDFTRKLIKINSVNGNEEEVAKVVRDKLKGCGIRSILFGKKDRKGLVAKIGKGKKSIILNGHLDTVPIGDIKKWKYPPFSAKLVNRKIYGRGAYDMKAGVAALTYAFISLLDKINGKAILLLTYDEEGGRHTGITDALNFIKGDACIVGEPSTKNHIDIGNRGVYRFKIISKGKSAHTGSLHSEGINSIVNLNKLLTKLVKIKYRAKNKMFPPFKITPTIIEGGVAINVVPNICNLFVDCRLTYGQTKNSVLKEIKKIVRSLKGGNISFKIEELAYIPPAVIDKKEEIVRKTLKNAEYIFRERQRLRIGGGASDANLMIKNGIPSIQLGPVGNNAHSENEFVYVKSILDYAKIYSLIAMDYLKI